MSDQKVIGIPVKGGVLMASQNNQYTNQAQLVLQNSQELVRRNRHNQLDVEHILLALLELEEGVPSRILAELGAPSNDIRAALHRSWSRPPSWRTRPTRST